MLQQARILPFFWARFRYVNHVYTRHCQKIIENLLLFFKKENSNLQIHAIATSALSKAALPKDMVQDLIAKHIKIKFF